MKKIIIPEGWEPGFPEKTQTGNYYLNGSEKMVYFWDGNQWHRATKDIFGELTWHVSLQKQPNTKFHKLIKRITI